MTNCFNCGIIAPESVDGTRTFARYNGNSINFTNCYELDGSQVTSVSVEDVTGGKLCYDLNEGAGKTIFYQTLGTDLHPVFDATHGVVIKDGVQTLTVIIKPTDISTYDNMVQALDEMLV